MLWAESEAIKLLTLRPERDNARGGKASMVFTRTFGLYIRARYALSFLFGGGF